MEQRTLTLRQARGRRSLQRNLANTLYKMIYGVSLWEDDEQYSNYMKDADEILRAYPHLLPAELRTDIQLGRQ